MLGIIGGTGLYNLEGLNIIDEKNITTPFGSPSSAIICSEYKSNKVFFLPRHGKDHQFLPHEVNYLANIWALKHLGVKQIISVSAVGSLKQEIKPGDFVIPSQYFDWVKNNRIKSFFGDGIVAHISTAQPSCYNLTQAIAKTAKNLNINLHLNKTYACVDGPRLGTKAESNFLRNGANCDIVGMTNIPEVFLAREAQICYCTIAIATDYDCWLDDPNQHVTVAMVIERFEENIAKVKQLLLKFLENDLPQIDEEYRQSLNNAILSKPENLTDKQMQLLNLLQA
jgi:5'-methylthioadenosine phosphorylase